MSTGKFHSIRSHLTLTSLSPFLPPHPGGPDYKCDKETEFSCRTNYRCVPLWARCNGMNDCIDNSDEEGCGEHLFFYSITSFMSPQSSYPAHIVWMLLFIVFFSYCHKQRPWPVTLWEISGVTTIAAFQHGGSVTATMTAAMARMRGVAVSCRAIRFILFVWNICIISFCCTQP